MKTKTFNIALPKDLVEKIDQTAKREYRNRSEFIRDAVLLRLQDLDNWERIFEIGKKTRQRLGIKNENQINRIVYEYRHGRKPKKGRA